jgi:hypothetical protein
MLAELTDTSDFPVTYQQQRVLFLDCSCFGASQWNENPHQPQSGVVFALMRTSESHFLMKCGNLFLYGFRKETYCVGSERRHEEVAEFEHRSREKAYNCQEIPEDILWNPWEEREHTANTPRTFRERMI